VKFQAKSPARILTVVLYNVIYVPGLRVNLVSLGALYREDVSIQIDRLGLVIEAGGKKLFHEMFAGWNGTLYHI